MAESAQLDIEYSSLLGPLTRLCRHDIIAQHEHAACYAAVSRLALHHRTRTSNALCPAGRMSCSMHSCVLQHDNGDLQLHAWLRWCSKSGTTCTKPQWAMRCRSGGSLSMRGSWTLGMMVLRMHIARRYRRGDDASKHCCHGSIALCT